MTPDQSYKPVTHPRVSCRAVVACQSRLAMRLRAGVGRSMRARRLLAGALLVLLGACTSPPGRYYSLVPPPAGAAARSVATAQPGVAAAAGKGVAAAYGLRLSVLQVPAEADRPQLVVRDPVSEPAVQVLNESLWAAPLALQVQAILAADVSRRLGVPDLQRLPGTTERPARRIDVRLTRFDMVWQQAVDLAATWTDQGPGDGPARVCQAQIRLDVTAAGVAQLVDAQREALHHLATLMARTPPGSPGGSPKDSGNTTFGCT